MKSNNISHLLNMCLVRTASQNLMLNRNIHKILFHSKEKLGLRQVNKYGTIEPAKLCNYLGT